jgi:DNA gyrase subunit A
MRQPVSAIRTIGRVTQGVKLVKLDKGTKISSISRVIHEENEDEEITQEKVETETETEKNEEKASENES